MVQAIVVPIATDAPRSMVRFISRIPAWVMISSMITIMTVAVRQYSWNFLPGVLPPGKERPHDRLPMRWNAELFESLATHGCKSRHVDLMADGLDLLTPQFIRVIEQAIP